MAIEKEFNGRVPLHFPFLESERRNRPLSKPPNIFFLVLKHSCLFLYEGEEQIVCSGVASIEGATAELYPRDLYLDEIFNRGLPIHLVSPVTSDLFYGKKEVFIFAANASEKEDWFYSLREATRPSPQIPESFGSTLESLRIASMTRAIFMERLGRNIRSDNIDPASQWINALLGRIFYNAHKNSMLERFIRKKFERKTSRMTLPFFVSPITLKEVLIGQSLPLLSHGHLHSVQEEGEVLFSANMHYPGGFRLQISTEIAWEIPSLNKITVPVVMSIHVRRLAGRMLFRIKAPPSDRLWIAFYRPPELQIDLEPMISDTVITWSIVKNAIMKIIRDDMQKSIVLPNMDDLTLPPLIIGDEFAGELPFIDAPLRGNLVGESQKETRSIPKSESTGRESKIIKRLMESKSTLSLGVEREKADLELDSISLRSSLSTSSAPPTIIPASGSGNTQPHSGSPRLLAEARESDLRARRQNLTIGSRSSSSLAATHSESVQSNSPSLKACPEGYPASSSQQQIQLPSPRLIENPATKIFKSPSLPLEHFKKKK